MSLSPDQIEQRSTRVTATDISCILGVNPFRSAIDVWAEKMGHGKAFTENDRTRWGNILEPAIRKDYEERHGVRVEVPGTLIAPARDWQAATPDGIVYRSGYADPDRGLEIKTHSRQAMFALEYGDPGTDEVPAHELCQAMWNIDVTGLARWDLVVFDGTPTEYIIDRDDELIGMMREQAERFLADHVRTGTPPPPDGTDAYSEWLKSRWKENDETILDVNDRPDVLEAIAKLRALKAQGADIEKEIEVIVQRLKLVIGERGGLTWQAEKEPGTKRRPKPPKITWKRSKESTWVDWVGIMADMRNRAALVASGSFTDLDLIESVLRKIGGGYVGNTTTSGAALLKTMGLVRETLTDIARAAMEPAHTKTKTGNRPFCTPRNWKSSTEQAQEQE